MIYWQLIGSSKDEELCQSLSKITAAYKNGLNDFKTPSPHSLYVVSGDGIEGDDIIFSTYEKAVKAGFESLPEEPDSRFYIAKYETDIPSDKKNDPLSIEEDTGLIYSSSWGKQGLIYLSVTPNFLDLDDCNIRKIWHPFRSGDIVRLYGAPDDLAVISYDQKEEELTPDKESEAELFVMRPSGDGLSHDHILPTVMEFADMESYTGIDKELLLFASRFLKNKEGTLEEFSHQVKRYSALYALEEEKERAGKKS